MAINLLWECLELDEVLEVIVLVEEQAALEHVVLPPHVLHLAVNH